MAQAAAIQRAINRKLQKDPEGYRARRWGKSEMEKAARAYAQGETGARKSQKSGGQRRWVTAVINRTREILNKKNIPVTNADIQALWWYPEQRLYYNLGVPKGSKGEADINVGYAEALKELALKKGAEIAQAAA